MMRSVHQSNPYDSHLNQGEIRIWPQILIDAKKAGRDGGFRLLILAKYLDKTGSGTVSANDLMQFLIDHGVDKNTRERWLRMAIELKFLKKYTRKYSGDIGYRLLAVEKAAKSIGCGHAGPRPAAIAVDKLLSRKWLCSVWGAMRAVLGDRPISRAKIAQVTGVPISTQKYLERDLSLIRTANYIVTDRPADHLDGFREFEHAHAFRMKQHGLKKVIAYRAPDSVTVPLEKARPLYKGRTRKINKHLNACLDQGPSGLLSLAQAPKDANSTDIQPMRLFLTNERRAEQIIDWVRKKHPNVGDIQEVFINITPAKVMAQPGQRKACFHRPQPLRPITKKDL